MQFSFSTLQSGIQNCMIEIQVTAQFGHTKRKQTTDYDPKGKQRATAFTRVWIKVGVAQQKVGGASHPAPPCLWWCTVQTGDGINCKFLNLYNIVCLPLTQNYYWLVYTCTMYMPTDICTCIWFMSTVMFHRSQNARMRTKAQLFWTGWKVASIRERVHVVIYYVESVLVWITWL